MTNIRVTMLTKIISCIKRWNDTTHWCEKCSTVNIEKTIDTVANVVCEFQVVCPKCEHAANYWAYGSYMEPTSRFAALMVFLIKTKWFFRTKIKIKTNSSESDF